MPTRKLQDYLESHHVQYRLIPHEPTPTAQEAAQAAHISGKHLAKSVVVKIDGTLGLAILPATDMVHLDQLRQSLGTQNVDFAAEDEFAPKFSDCEVGAIPPFGNLYGMDVYVSQHLREDEEIAFSGGTHHELVQMTYGDFERLVHPCVLRF